MKSKNLETIAVIEPGKTVTVRLAPQQPGETREQALARQDEKTARIKAKLAARPDFAMYTIEWLDANEQPTSIGGWLKQLSEVEAKNFIFETLLGGGKILSVTKV